MPFAGYDDFDDCVAKNKDKGDPNAYCGSIKAKVEEVNRIFAKEQDAQEPEGLTTPDAGDQGEDVTKDLTSPQGSAKEAENPQASGRGELSPANPSQDQAEPEANPQDQAEPPNAGHQTSSKQNDEDKVEYDGETYHKVESLEYDGRIYVPKCTQCPKQARENDLDYEGTLYEEADNNVLQLDDDYYIKDEEQAPMDTDISQPTPTTAVDIPELNPIGESVIIKENGRYRKYNIFQATEQEDLVNRKEGDYKEPEDEFKDKKRDEHQASEQEEDSITPPAEVKDAPPIETPQGDIADRPEEPKTEPVEQKASEEMKAIEKIIVKENGKLRFKSVFTEVKKKL